MFTLHTLVGGFCLGISYRVAQSLRPYARECANNYEIYYNTKVWTILRDIKVPESNTDPDKLAKVFYKEHAHKKSETDTKMPPK